MHTIELTELKNIHLTLLSYVERLDRMGLYMDREELQGEGYEDEEIDDLMNEREQLDTAIKTVSNAIKASDYTREPLWICTLEIKN